MEIDDVEEISDSIVDNQNTKPDANCVAYQLAWGRLRNYPYWPCVVLDSKTWSTKWPKLPKTESKSEFIAYWLDSGKVSYIRSKNVVEFFLSFRHVYEPKKKKDNYLKAVDFALKIAIQYNQLEFTSEQLKSLLLSNKLVLKPIIFDSIESFEDSINALTMEQKEYPAVQKKFKPKASKIKSSSFSQSLTLNSFIESDRNCCKCCQSSLETRLNNFVDCYHCVTVDLGPKVPFIDDVELDVVDETNLLMPAASDNNDFSFKSPLNDQLYTDKEYKISTWSIRRAKKSLPNNFKTKNVIVPFSISSPFSLKQTPDAMIDEQTPSLDAEPVAMTSVTANSPKEMKVEEISMEVEISSCDDEQTHSMDVVSTAAQVSIILPSGMEVEEIARTVEDSSCDKMKVDECASCNEHLPIEQSACNERLIGEESSCIYELGAEKSIIDNVLEGEKNPCSSGVAVEESATNIESIEPFDVKTTFSPVVDDICDSKPLVDVSYGCFCCPKSLGNISELELHLKHHLTEFAFKCGYCTYSSDFHAELAAHTSCHFLPDSSTRAAKIEPGTSSKNTWFDCTFCGRKMNNYESLRRHENLHGYA